MYFKSLLDQCVGVARRKHRCAPSVTILLLWHITTVAIVLTDFLMHTRHDQTLASIGNFLFLDVLLLGAVDMSNFVSI
jgi:hypothetical protein